MRELSKFEISRDISRIEGGIGIADYPWEMVTVRFRPDQISKFRELYPDKPFTPTIRMILDTFLDGKKPTPHRVEEVRRLREKTSKQLAMLEEELKQLENEERHKIMAEAIEKERQQYMADHPDILDEYMKGNFSTRGYHRLMQSLKFSSTKQVQEFLQRMSNEQGIPAEQELSRS